ncbi:mfs general substrate transporter [Phaffia rhodozyma]|uniref:Mfs general substrate transporter n=1 Tax=Phaffia rhodozyma TaxID=264483 RepID=A0A0F7SVE4_PHARH|nr:mfs general substrate transporter [Phaffia rhodozyma]
MSASYSLPVTDSLAHDRNFTSTTHSSVPTEEQRLIKLSSATDDKNILVDGRDQLETGSDPELLRMLQVSDDELVGDLTYEQLSLYEKKSVLINRELDKMNTFGSAGLGRYQWCIFLLCGFGYFLDLAWAQAFGLISGAIQQELGIADSKIGDIFVAFSAGLTVGAFFWGIAADVIGRKWCFNITCAISSVAGLLFAAPSNFGALCFLISVVGLGVGGNIPLDSAIVLEFLPTNRRFLLAVLSTFQPIGVVVSCGVAYGLVPKYSCDTSLPSCQGGETPCCTKSSNMGWRYFTITLGVITFLIFVARFVLFDFQESPKFLLSKGRDEEALRVLYNIAEFNKAPVPDLTLEDFHALDKAAGVQNIETHDNTQTGVKTILLKGLNNFSHLKGFFSSKRMIWLTVSLWIAYMSLFFSFSIAGGYLPLILRQKGIDTSTSISVTYRNYIIVYLPGTIATILAGVLMEIKWLGRKWAMALGAGLMGASLFLFSAVSSVAGFVGFNLMEYFFQSLYCALLYAFTPEAFPAPYRGTASGIASTLGRLASTVAPFAAGSIFNPRSNGVLYMAGGAAFVSMLSVATLPFETRGKHSF